MKDKIFKHFHENDYLEDNEIFQIMQDHPDCVYQGEAYRVLIFKRSEQLNQKFSLDKDKSFSLSLRGIQHFLDMNDAFSYYILFRVNLTGLNSQTLCDTFNINNPHSGEEEVIAYKINDFSILSQGQIKDFQNNI